MGWMNVEQVSNSIKLNLVCDFFLYFNLIMVLKVFEKLVNFGFKWLLERSCDKWIHFDEARRGCLFHLCQNLLLLVSNWTALKMYPFICYYVQLNFCLAYTSLWVGTKSSVNTDCVLGEFDAPEWISSWPVSANTVWVMLHFPVIFFLHTLLQCSVQVNTLKTDNFLSLVQYRVILMFP